MTNDQKLNLASVQELRIIEEFKKEFRQEIECDDVIIDLVFECIKDLYLYFKGDVDLIPKECDSYNYYIFAGSEKEYTLLEFLLNRVAQNIERINYSVYSSNEYDLCHKTMSINKNRYNKVKEKYSQSTIAMFLKKSVYHETIHAIQSNPIFGDKNKFIESINKKDIFSQKIEFYNRLKRYNKLGIKTNDVTYNQLMDASSRINPMTCSESINEYRSINEASVEMLAVELSKLRQYVENLNMDENEKLLFYELSSDKQIALLIPNPENGYKYNAHFMRLLLNLVGRKKFFFEFFTPRDDLFLDLQKRYLVGKNFEENLRDDFLLTEGNNNIDYYYQIISKYFYLYDELNPNCFEDWLPFVLEETNDKKR